ncbi:MAG: hypothetical protein EXX96DRAFT_542172 [Benjaminiella poitrasii]|nr:MAG: hypothetical protein EXX96DRAFT_542172 [Benjaminiella poitrasii]
MMKQMFIFQDYRYIPYCHSVNLNLRKTNRAFFCDKVTSNPLRPHSTNNTEKEKEKRRRPNHQDQRRPNTPSKAAPAKPDQRRLPDTHHQRPRAPFRFGRPRHPHPQRLPLQREGEEMLNGISQTVPDPAPIPITLIRVAVAIGSEVLVTASKFTPSKREHRSDSSTVVKANTQSNRKQRTKSRQRLLC